MGFFKVNYGKIGILIILISIQPVLVSKVVNLDQNCDTMVSERVVIKSENRINAPPSVIRIGEIWRPIDYDPLHQGNAANLKKKSLMYDSLLEIDPVTNEPVSGLATQYYVTEDSKIWIFDLRQDITFHDGSKFNASSVKYNFDRMINSALPEYLPVESIPLESVEILSEFRIKVNLNEPYAPFSTLVGTWMKFLSPNSFNKTGHLTNPIGTGPYILNIDSSDDYFQNFTRFADYYKALPPFEQIHYYNFGSTSPYLWENYETYISNHDLDFVSSILLRDMEIGTMEQVLDDSYWTVTIMDQVTTQGMFYINHDVPRLGNRNVRKALNYAINRAALNEDYYTGTAASMKNFLPSGVLFANDSIPGYPYNVTKANELLDQAGYLKGTDGYRFDLELLGSSITEVLRSQIALDLDEVGIRANVVTPHDWWNRFDSGNYELILLGSGILQDPDYLWDMVSSDNAFKYIKYSNETITALLNQGRQTPIEQEREYFYNEAQWLLHDDAPFVCLTDRNMFFAASTEVKDYIFLNKLFEIDFDFSDLSPSKMQLLTLKDINDESDIQITDNVKCDIKAVYLPMTDILLSSVDQHENTFSVKMSHNLENILPNEVEIGKFYEITPVEKDKPFTIRAYYNSWEVNNNPSNSLTLHKYNVSSSSWDNIHSVSSNVTFRYLETILEGDTLLKIELISEDVSSSIVQTTPLDYTIIFGFLIPFYLIRKRKRPL